MKASVRVLFLGTPHFALPSLRVIHQYAHLTGVITQPDRPFGRKMQLKPSPVSELSSTFDVPVFKCESPQKILDEIRALKADCALVVAYGQILTQQFLDIFPKKVINLHASLLPRWRGAAPIQRALIAGDTLTGVCLQKVVKKLDAGPLLGQKSYNIPKGMKADQLSQVLSEMGAQMIKDVFLKYLEDETTILKEQDESLVTYAPKVTKEEGLLKFDDSAESLFNKYRGLFVWPQVWLKRSGKVLKIKKMQIHDKESLQNAPGLVINVSSNAITVSCGKGAVDILEVQPESRSSMTVKEYMHGYPVQVGEIWQ